MLLLEHPHVFTHGPRADLATNVLVDPTSVDAELVSVKRGGDVTYHGPGQLVGYPIVNVPNSMGAADHVCAIQRVIVESLTELGLDDVGCLDEYPGVWVGVSGPDPRKICAIGVRLARGRTMHGFALNVAPDMRYMRDYIVPCGIADKPVTSLVEEGVDASLQQVADVVARNAAAQWGGGSVERQDVAWKHRPEDLSAFSRGEGPGAVVRRLAQVGIADGLEISSRKPEWLRPKVVHGPEVISLKKTVRDLGLVTVCEEAGCPNLSDCWADGTATFMSRIRLKKVSAETGEDVPDENIVKGYEISKGQYVVVDPDELEPFIPSATRSIDLEEFVDLAEIDPVYFDSPYILAPDKTPKPYALLAQAMESAGKVAIGRFVMRNKQYVAAVRASEGTLLMSTMVFADEVVPVDSIDELEVLDSIEISPKEVKMAEALVESLSADFDPSKYRDAYREQVLDLIERKAAGELFETPAPAAAAPQVVDLMAKFSNSKRKAPPLAAARASSTVCPAGTTSLPIPSPGMVAIL